MKCICLGSHLPKAIGFAKMQKAEREGKKRTMNKQKDTQKQSIYLPDVSYLQPRKIGNS